MCDYRKKNPKPFKKREIKTGMYVKLVMKTADLWERLQGKKAPKKGPARTAYMAAKKVYTDEILRRKMK